MQTKDLMIETLERAEERFLETLDMMTVEEANTAPNPLLKSVTWLIWHTARTVDFQIAHLAGGEPLYRRNNWETRFNLNLPSDTKDWIHTAEEAQKVQVSDKQLLIDYLQEAIAFGKAYLQDVKESALDDIVDESWEPAVTRGVRLVSTIDDAVMHSGQAIYTRRLVLGQ
ncbi:DinB family protein [Streptococcus cuniculi]|uniref:DinB family protein n=1 Tax=Streptococcus cuniculi TaxID=1432788 RepID=A0A4Y9JAZ7_9STRE|nr:DinB family protein [Streptococcus cuniculi]MBF0778107.1 DinB family protein [Streptococcus cuniculi]TFU98112.1 DinB family protein [Streptococcus cuniculi]